MSARAETSIADRHSSPVAGRSGQCVGQYELNRWLGSGGFGQVWLAEHRFLTGRRAAVKLPVSVDAVTQLRQDGALQATLDHPAIVPVLKQRACESPCRWTVAVHADPC